MALILSNLVAVEWRYDIFLQSEVGLFLLIFAILCATALKVDMKLNFYFLL